MTTKHTPLPWTFTPSKQVNHGRGIKTFLGCEVTDCTNHKSIFLAPHATMPEQWEANAEFIVRACNAHYELLAIVQRLAANQSGELIVYNNLRAEARAAIAKAEGKEHSV